MSYLTISGEGFSTGKSLMADVCRLALYGNKKECIAPTTVSTLYDMLSKGKAIYGKMCNLDINNSSCDILTSSTPSLIQDNIRIIYFNPDLVKVARLNLF